MSAAALQHYTAQAAIASAAMQPWLRYATFDSAALGAEVCVGYEVEEAECYQFGATLATVTVVEVWHAGWNCTLMLSDAVLRSLKGEFEREFFGVRQ